MKKIKVEIKRLGAIVNSTIDISPVMLFSGESGVGKSYLAMMCHYFFDVLLSATRINRYVEGKGWNFLQMREKFHNSGLAITISKADFESWLAEDCLTYLRWMLNNDKLKGEIVVHLPESIDERIDVRYEEEVLGLVDNEDYYLKLHMLDLTYRVPDGRIESESPFSFLLRHCLIHHLLGDFKNLREEYVFPPSRGPMLTEEVKPRTGLYEKYRNTIFNIERVSPHPESVSIKLKSLFNSILNGQISRKAGTYMYMTSNEEIPISAAAASVREIAPLSLLVERTDISKIAILFEEPEAHLHPLKQRMMADIIACFINSGAYMQITTHSDYFLRRMNELINLGKLKDKWAGEQERFKILCDSLGVDEELALNFSHMTAYLVENQGDGTSRIIQQNIQDGVPFASFSKAIEESLHNSYQILDNL